MLRDLRDLAFDVSYVYAYIRALTRSIGSGRLPRQG